MENLIKSIKFFIYGLGKLTGTIFLATKAAQDFNEACKKLNEMMMHKRILEWEGCWLLSVPDYSQVTSADTLINNFPEFPLWIPILIDMTIFIQLPQRCLIFLQKLV